LVTGPGPDLRHPRRDDRHRRDDHGGHAASVGDCHQPAGVRAVFFRIGFTGRHVVEAPLRRDSDGGYDLDLEALDRVALSPGLDFGTQGRGFARLNMGTSPTLMLAAVRRMAAATAAPKS
jgi:bifunctional pyridoxal-dependent enzyme with beta-cystathionase and maltose regulon repressor activities